MILKKKKYIIYDIDLNERVQQNIEKKEIKFDSKSNDKTFKFFINIMKNNKDFSKLFKSDNNHLFFNTIKTFVNIFPNISHHIFNYELDYFDLLEKNKVREIIQNYIILIKTNLKNEKYINEKNEKEIYYKIYDYIMENLYDKLFPKEQIQKDLPRHDRRRIRHAL